MTLISPLTETGPGDDQNKAQALMYDDRGTTSHHFLESILGRPSDLSDNSYLLYCATQHTTSGSPSPPHAYRGTDELTWCHHPGPDTRSQWLRIHPRIIGSIRGLEGCKSYARSSKDLVPGFRLPQMVLERFNDLRTRGSSRWRRQPDASTSI